MTIGFMIIIRNCTRPITADSSISQSSSFAVIQILKGGEACHGWSFVSIYNTELIIWLPDVRVERADTELRPVTRYRLCESTAHPESSLVEGTQSFRLVTSCRQMSYKAVNLLYLFRSCQQSHSFSWSRIWVYRLQIWNISYFYTYLSQDFPHSTIINSILLNN